MKHKKFVISLFNPKTQQTIVWAPYPGPDFPEKSAEISEKFEEMNIPGTFVSIDYVPAPIKFMQPPQLLELRRLREVRRLSRKCPLFFDEALEEWDSSHSLSQAELDYEERIALLDEFRQDFYRRFSEENRLKES